MADKHTGIGKCIICNKDFYIGVQPQALRERNVCSIDCALAFLIDKLTKQEAEE